MKYDFNHMSHMDIVRELRSTFINDSDGPQSGCGEDEICELMDEAATRIIELMDQPVCRCNND